MKEQQTSQQDLKAIRQMMEDSSRFLSLSGLSGIAAGTFAIIGAFIAHFFILDRGKIIYDEYLLPLKMSDVASVRVELLSVAVVVFVSAVMSAWYISWRKVKKEGGRFWTTQARRMTANLIFFLAVGGAFSGILVLHGGINLIASAMLIFYGIALINAAKYTLRDIKFLGLCEIVLGLIAGVFVNYGLIFWTLGFGVLHIIYGITMYYKYER